VSDPPAAGTIRLHFVSLHSAHGHGQQREINFIFRIKSNVLSEEGNVRRVEGQYKYLKFLHLYT